MERITMRQFYRDKYRKDKTIVNHISDTDFRKIVSGYMEFIVNKIIAGYNVEFNNVGTFYVKGLVRKARLKDGEIWGVTNWPETRKLWENDPIAREQKKRIFYLNTTVYKISWKKSDIKMHNKELYYFYPTRAQRIALSHSVKEGKEYFTAPSSILDTRN